MDTRLTRSGFALVLLLPLSVFGGLLRTRSSRPEDRRASGPAPQAIEAIFAGLQSSDAPGTAVPLPFSPYTMTSICTLLLGRMSTVGLGNIGRMPPAV